MTLKSIWSLIVDSGKAWGKDRAHLYAAAISYYTVFSLAPLFLIAIAVAGLVFGQEAARGELMGQIQGLIGSQGAKMIQGAMAGVSKPAPNILATIIGAVVLLFGASGVFLQLQTSLNHMWGVEPKPSKGFWNVIRTRVLSFGIVIATGFLLLVSLIISAAVAALSGVLESLLTGAAVITRILTLLISLGVIGGVFAAIFKLIPDAEISWRDAWIGGLVTSVLFNIGRFLIGLYLGQSTVASAYGAAASLVIILLWVYYSAMIMFFGAEFTKVYSERFGSHIRPAEYAQESQAA